MFLTVSRDPAKYRPLMLPAILEKLAWVVPVSILFLQNRVSWQILGAGMIDLSFGVLFAVSYFKTGADDKT